MELSEDTFYEVPIINLEDVDVSKKTATKLNKNFSNELENCQGSSSTHINQNSNEVNANNLQLTDDNGPTPIIIVDDSEQDNNCTVIDVIDSQETKPLKCNSKSNSNCENVFDFDVIRKENKLIAEIIEKCLDMEYSSGMLRIINRTLIPLYKDTNDAFKQSYMFQKKLSHTIIKLDTEPNRKFSHLKTLCETLKNHLEKKRVSLVTLKKNLNGKFSTNKTTFSAHNHNIPIKKKNIDVINLDDDDDVMIDCNSDTNFQVNDISGQVIDYNTSSVQVVNNCNTHIEINDPEIDSDIQLHEQSDEDDDVILINESDKSSTENRTDTRHNDLSERRIAKMRKHKDTLNNNEAAQIDLCNDDDSIESSSNVKDVQVAHIEKEIAKYNAMIKVLEEKEDDTDFALDSPYVQCDIFKTKVVDLYKELCKLTGTASVKHHKVRLKVAAGRPEGPVRCLEKFINKNIDENGNPPFPDLHDVINCVCKANMRYKMGWSKKQIEEEARALFIFYGRTIQKRRQRREWRDLMAYVKKEAPDPADNDPMLQTRLQQNSKVAKRKEKELIDRYAQMENSSRLRNQCFRLGIEYPHEIDSDCRSTSVLNNLSENTISEANYESQNRIRMENYADSCHGHITDNLLLYNPWNAPAQQVATYGRTIDPVYSVTDNQNLETLTAILAGMRHNFAVPINNPEPYRTNVNTEQNLDVYTNIGTVTDMTEIGKCLAIEYEKKNEENLKPNFEEREFTSAAIQNNEVTTSLVERVTVTNNDVDDRVNVTENLTVPDSSDAFERNIACEVQRSDAGSSQTDLKDVKVKHEPLDIPCLLAQLGDNYTATIIEIEDPFMVIEISDSSDSEDEIVQ